MPESHMPTLDEYRAYDRHSFADQTNYCVHCGQRASHVVENQLKCFQSDKLVPISHLRRKPVDELAGADTIWKNPA